VRPRRVDDLEPCDLLRGQPDEVGGTAFGEIVENEVEDDLAELVVRDPRIDARSGVVLEVLLERPELSDRARRPRLDDDAFGVAIGRSDRSRTW
jgi:hypothetical protein